MVSRYELKNIMNILDSDGSNYIEYQEFLRATCDKKLLFKEENLRAVFGVIDKNKKGYATPEDIRRFVLGNDKKITNRSTLRGCTAQIGMKKNSKLTFEQFSEMIRNNTLLPKKDNDDDSSEESEEEEDILKLQKKAPLSSKNLIEKIQNDKIMYNMTEGDDIIDEPHKPGKSGFYRINTTKS